MGLLAGLGILLQIAASDCLQPLHVGPRAESAASAGDDDDLDVGIVGRPVETVEVGRRHLTRPGIEPVGAVEGEGRHTFVDFVQNNVFFAHVSSGAPQGWLG